MLNVNTLAMWLAGNEGGGSKTHVNGWTVLGILVACGIALYFGGKRD